MLQIVMETFRLSDLKSKSLQKSLKQTEGPISVLHWGVGKQYLKQRNKNYLQIVKMNFSRNCMIQCDACDYMTNGCCSMDFLVAN